MHAPSMDAARAGGGSSARRSTLAAFALTLALMTLAAWPAWAAPVREARPRDSIEADMAALAGAERPPRLLFSEDFVVRTGETAEIRWTLPGPDVDELEILMSLDGGRRFPLRVSPEIEAATCRFLWHVPRGLSGQARLRVRYNLRGRETLGEPTAVFTILAVAPGESPSPLVHEGEWWAGAGPLDAPGCAAAWSPPHDRVVSGSDLPSGGIVARGVAMPEPSRVHARAERAASARLILRSASLGSAARLSPLRN